MHQIKNLKLLHLYCYNRQICETWKVEERNKNVLLIRKRMYSLLNVENYENTEYTENNI